MQTVRDLGRDDPWQESLERSLARRGKRQSERGHRSAPAEHRRDRDQRPSDHRHSHDRDQRPSDHRHSRPSPGDDRVSRRPAERRRDHRDGRRRGLAAQPKVLAVGSWGVLVLTVVMVTVGGLVDGHGAQASAGLPRARPAASHFTPLPVRAATRPTRTSVPVRATRTCRPVPKSSGYVNPLAGDTLINERIDQGVDYAGSGTLTAIGAARLTYVGTSGTGWPGAFLEYRLLEGPDAGCFVYYAEGITPSAGLRPGQRVRTGQVLATIIPGWATGIELGWGAGVSTKTYAARSGRWNASDDAGSVASEAGKSFSALIAGLGGPPGRVEG